MAAEPPHGAGALARLYVARARRVGRPQRGYHNDASTGPTTCGMPGAIIILNKLTHRYVGECSRTACARTDAARHQGRIDLGVCKWRGLGPADGTAET